MALWSKRKQRQEMPPRCRQVPGGQVEVLSNMVFKAEHCLIAGTTGCGKSTLLHGIMRDLLRSYSPEQVKLVLIDPKLVELSRYRSLPHVVSYADTSKGAVEALRGVEREMMRRYEVMRSRGWDNWPGGLMFVVIDELAPLMLKTNPYRKEFQPLMQNILQLGRASGIRVVAATQAPNRQVIPAELVLNFSMRIGMRCLSQIESRQIIGSKGCELLPLHGRALVVYGPEMRPAVLNNTDRAEVNEIIEYWKAV